MKKKFFSIMLCFCFVLALGVTVFGVSAKQNTTLCFAATTVAAAAETEETQEEAPVEVTTPAEKEETHTFLSRVWEFIETNYPEIASTVGSIIVMIMLIIYNVKSKKKLLQIGTTVTKSSGTQSEVVDVVNSLIEGYNTLEEKMTKYNDTEDERYIAVGTLIAQTKAILEILTTVYANSKNIPQGVKDLVNLKYANVLKTIEDSEKVKEIAIEEEKATEETQESNTEV